MCLRRLQHQFDVGCSGYYREFNKTFVIVTHDPKVAECATRVLHMDKGVLVESAQLWEASL